MKLFIKIKQTGKRKLLLANSPIVLDLSYKSCTLRTLITKIVERQVKAYNTKETEVHIIDFITNDCLRNQSTTGKVGFEAVYHKGKEDNQTAIKNALFAFEDGLFAVAIDKKIIQSLQEIIILKEESELIFIKLTLLKG